MQTEQEIALSKHQQLRVWEGWLGAEIRGYYFADLVSEYKQRQKLITWVILLCSSGTCGVVLSRWNAQWPTLALSLLITGLSLFLLVYKYEDRITKCSDLHREWGFIANDYEAIWENVYAPDAGERLRSLSSRELDASKNALDIRDDDKRLLKCQEYVERQHGAR